MQSYTPPVPKHMYDVEFVPVIESFDKDVRFPMHGDDIDLPHRLSTTSSFDPNLNHTFLVKTAQVKDTINGFIKHFFRNL